MAMTKLERIKRDEMRFEMMNSNERELRKNGYSLIAGIDEVGRGPLAGPVVAVSVVLPENFKVLGIYDSKSVTERKRNLLFKEIREKALAVGVGFVDNNRIDEINILEATKEAMKKAIKNTDGILQRKGLGSTEYLLLDALNLEDVKKEQLALIKGDQKSISIAAASIVAKVIRDNYMEFIGNSYKEYGFDSHKGYGTKKHYEALNKYGITKFHRKSFLKKLL